MICFKDLGLCLSTHIKVALPSAHADLPGGLESVSPVPARVVSLSSGAALS